MLGWDAARVQQGLLRGVRVHLQSCREDETALHVENRVKFRADMIYENSWCWSCSKQGMGQWDLKSCGTSIQQNITQPQTGMDSYHL